MGACGVRILYRICACFLFYEYLIFYRPLDNGVESMYVLRGRREHRQAFLLSLGNF
jgi:hypothetical protein